MLLLQINCIMLHFHGLDADAIVRNAGLDKERLFIYDKL